MRVISQDGMQDIPYEKFVFSITKDNRIVATTGCTAPPAELYMSSVAKYSTQEKAMKAMEMLREKYLSRMELDGGYYITNGHYVQPNFWVLPRVFQFPKDEDVEV